MLAVTENDDSYRKCWMPQRTLQGMPVRTGHWELQRLGRSLDVQGKLQQMLSGTLGAEEDDWTLHRTLDRTLDVGQNPALCTGRWGKLQRTQDAEQDACT